MRLMIMDVKSLAQGLNSVHSYCIITVEIVVVDNCHLLYFFPNNFAHLFLKQECKPTFIKTLS